jgi:hypothetical protein
MAWPLQPQYCIEPLTFFFFFVNLQPNYSLGCVQQVHVHCSQHACRSQPAFRSFTGWAILFAHSAGTSLGHRESSPLRTELNNLPPFPQF